MNISTVSIRKHQTSDSAWGSPDHSFTTKKPSKLLLSFDADSSSTNYEKLLGNICNITISDYESLIECEITKVTFKRSYTVLRNCAAYESNYTSTLMPFSESDVYNILDFFNGKRVTELSEVDVLLNSRYFFSALQREQRIHLIHNTIAKTCSKGEMLVSDQEVIPELLYVVKGSLKVFNTTGEYSRKIKWGQIFAEELSFESDYNPLGYHKHYYDKFSITALENTIVLVTKREAFDSLIRNELRNELFQKLYTLKRCILFKDIPVNQLLRMVNRISLVVKHYWEIIQKQDTLPNKCFVIAKGICKAIYERATEGNQLPRECIRKYMVKPADALRFGNFITKVPTDSAHYPYKEIEFYADEYNKSAKMRFTYNVDFGIIKEGDYLCSRALLADQEFSTGKVLPSQLTVVTDTAHAVILEIPYEALLVLDPRFIVHFDRKVNKHNRS